LKIFQFKALKEVFTFLLVFWLIYALICVFTRKKYLVLLCWLYLLTMMRFWIFYGNLFFILIGSIKNGKWHWIWIGWRDIYKVIFLIFFIWIC